MSRRRAWLTALALLALVLARYGSEKWAAHRAEPPTRQVGTEAAGWALLGMERAAAEPDEMETAHFRWRRKSFGGGTSLLLPEGWTCGWEEDVSGYLCDSPGDDAQLMISAQFVGRQGDGAAAQTVVEELRPRVVDYLVGAGEVHPPAAMQTARGIIVHGELAVETPGWGPVISHRWYVLEEVVQVSGAHLTRIFLDMPRDRADTPEARELVEVFAGQAARPDIAQALPLDDQVNIDASNFFDMDGVIWTRVSARLVCAPQPDTASWLCTDPAGGPGYLRILYRLEETPDGAPFDAAARMESFRAGYPGSGRKLVSAETQEAELGTLLELIEEDMEPPRGGTGIERHHVWLHVLPDAERSDRAITVLCALSIPVARLEDERMKTLLGVTRRQMDRMAVGPGARTAWQMAASP